MFETIGMFTVAYFTMGAIVVCVMLLNNTSDIRISIRDDFRREGWGWVVAMLILLITTWPYTWFYTGRD